MKPIFQTIFSVPGGNCLQACLASIFELPLDQVPHFANIETDDWFEKCQTWCSQFGVYPIHCPAEGVQSPTLFKGYQLIAVKTINGHDHVVVGKDGEIVHDPVQFGVKPIEITGYILFVSTMGAV